MYEHNVLGYWACLALYMFDKSQKQSSAVSCYSTYLSLMLSESISTRL